jgi:peptidoglycan hydrolase-like protein with peptidoglycan-binding domain
MPTPPRSLAVRIGIALLAPAALLITMAPAAAATVTPSPSIPAGLPNGIEVLAGYVPANSCSPTPKPGSVQLAKLLKLTYPDTSYGIGRACGPLPNSEHFDGRAIDWMNSIRDQQQAAQAKAVIGWLLATDRAGHPYANARRLGVMYVIWNDRIWGAYSADQGWRAYNNCALLPSRSSDTVCHRDHMHISLSWEGAMGRTSFWTKSVAAAEYGPCRPVDLNWAPPYLSANFSPCPRYPTVNAPSGASATLKTLTQYSGMELRTGAGGPAVVAVQRAIKTTVSGYYGSATKAAVAKWQSTHGRKATGIVGAKTWRSLLKDQAPQPS